jgi:SAM-dependent methyltransferase
MCANRKIENIFLKAHAAVRASLPFLSPVDLLKRQIADDAKIVLDLGCGKGTSLSIELAQRKDVYLVGVDLFLPSLIEAKSIYKDVVLADVRFLPFRPASCDVAVGSQVIEHLEKSVNFINRLEEISKKTVIITVPVGSNPKHDLEDYNLHQAHKSEWYPEEFKKLGFQVWGCEGARFLRNEQSQFKMCKAFYLFFYFLSIFTQFITYKLVVASYQMLCVKQLH